MMQQPINRAGRIPPSQLAMSRGSEARLPQSAQRGYPPDLREPAIAEAGPPLHVNRYITHAGHLLGTGGDQRTPVVLAQRDAAWVHQLGPMYNAAAILPPFAARRARAMGDDVPRAPFVRPWLRPNAGMNAPTTAPVRRRQADVKPLYDMCMEYVAQHYNPELGPVKRCGMSLPIHHSSTPVWRRWISRRRNDCLTSFSKQIGSPRDIWRCRSVMMCGVDDGRV